MLSSAPKPALLAEAANVIDSAASLSQSPLSASMSRVRPKNRLAVAAGGLLWLGIALVALPLAWSVAFTRFLSFGFAARPYWAVIVPLLAIAQVALFRWLFPTWPRQRWIVLAFAAACCAHAAGWFWQVSNFSEPSVVVVYMATTICLLGAATIGVRTSGTVAGVRLLSASLMSLVAAALLIDCQSLDGGGRPIVGWRFESVVNAAATPLTDRTITPADSAMSSDNDFPCFRGEDGLGVVSDTRLNTDWSANAPRRLWQRAVGKGWGGFAVVGPRAYTLEQRGERECLVCYEAVTGLEQWVHADRTSFASATAGDGPRSTPSVHDGRVVSLGAMGLLNCLDASTGQRYWSVDVLKAFDASNLYHGLSGSPLVVDGMVIVSVGGRGHSLATFDLYTGRAVWQAGDDEAGYGSPVAYTLGDRKQVVILNRLGLAAHDVATGELLWTFPWTNDTETNCSQPVPLGNDRVLVSTGYGKGCALLEVKQTGDEWSVQTLWTSKNLKTRFSSAVVHDGCAFGLDEGVLACIDLADGSRRWKAGRYGHGQVLLVDDVLLLQCESGQVVLVAADPVSHRELARYQALTEKTWNYPALVGRLLLVRNDHEAACFELPTR